MAQPENPIQIAQATLELSLDPKIWRTKLRIQEIMLKKHPDLRGNTFVTYLNHLLTLILTGISTGDIILSTYNRIDGERYEEGESEPILITDIPEVKTYGAQLECSERFYATGLMQGKSYDQICHELSHAGSIDKTAIMKVLIEKGLASDRVFYRRVDTPRHKKTQESPSLTTY